MKMSQDELLGGMDSPAARNTELTKFRKDNHLPHILEVLAKYNQMLASWMMDDLITNKSEGGSETNLEDVLSSTLAAAIMRNGFIISELVSKGDWETGISYISNSATIMSILRLRHPQVSMLGDGWDQYVHDLMNGGLDN